MTPPPHDPHLAVFSTERRALLSLAYRMLGSLSDAEDVVQDAFVRWRDVELARVDSPPAWLRTTVTRLCLDAMKSARTRRESYVGEWLPEPVRTDVGAFADEQSRADPESISMAFLVVLDSLSPLERAAWLLHDVFEYDHTEVAHALDRTEASARQLIHRAREHIASRRPRFARSREEHTRLVGAFMSACGGGDVMALQRLLADDVVVWSDGGGRVSAAIKPVRGPDHVSRLLLGLVRKGATDATIDVVDINGWPGIVIRRGAVIDSVTTLEFDGELLATMHIVRNPDKLARFDAELSTASAR